MKNLIISFKSRNELIAFSRILNSYNIPNTKMNTPHIISASCGLSLRTDFADFLTIKNLLLQSNLKGFIGIYFYQRIGSQERIEKLF